MYKGLMKYLCVLIFLYGVWSLLLGYFLFLLFALGVLLFFFSVIVSYKSMRMTDVIVTCHRSILERHENLYMTFTRVDKSLFHCGSLIVDYSVIDSLGKVIYRRKQKIYDQLAMDALTIDDCGYYYVQIHHIYCFDLLGCIHFKRSSNQHAYFYVFPSLIPIDMQLENTVGFTQDSTEYSPYQSGEDYLEIFDLRPYHEHDSLRHIHWKASLKKDELFVKIGSQPIVKKILLAVELHHMREDNQALDRFYSLCSLLLKRQVHFEILCPQSHTEGMVPELILNQEHLRECMKRILKDMSLKYQSALAQNHDYLSVFVVSSQGIEVYEK